MTQILCDHDRKDYESNTISFAHEIGLIKSPKIVCQQFRILINIWHMCSFQTFQLNLDKYQIFNWRKFTNFKTIFLNITLLSIIYTICPPHKISGSLNIKH